MRSAILFALALIVGSAFAMPLTQSEQKATVPPGPPLPLAVETVKPVNDDPVPVPAADPLEIVAYIGGEEITTEHVELPVGRLLTLKTRGTALKDDETPAVHWSMNRESLDYSIYPDHGHHLTFTAPEAGTWLLVAAVNNSEPLLPPHVAMRWVVVTGAQPPPGPTPTPTPGPTPPPVVEGKRSLVIVSESSKDKAAFSRLIINLRDGSAAAYLKSKGHTFDWLDADQLTPSDPWRSQFTAADLPVAFIIDSATNTVLSKEPVSSSTTADNLIEAVKRQGG